MTGQDPAHDGPYGVTRGRAVAAALVALASMGMLLCLRSSAELARWLFDFGNVLGMNEQSGLSLARTQEILRHLQLALLGTASLAGLMAAAGMANAVARTRPKLADRLVAIVPFAMVISVIVFVASQQIVAHSFVLNGRRHFYFLDDAMNSMRYAVNFAQGQGLSYNPGDHVEGYTNFLWVLVMAAIHRLGAGVASAPMWVMVLSWACLALAACLSMDLVRAAKLDRYWCLCVGLLVACDENVVVWASSGLETAALMATVTACAWALLRDRPRTFAIALAAMVLMRADGFVLAVPIVVLAYLLPGRGWSFPRFILPVAVVLVGHFVFRRIYYGDWLPNTYYLRMIGAADRLKIGLGGYGLRLAAGYALLLVLATAAASSRRLPTILRLLVAVALLYVGYAVWLGGDIFCGLRFVTPVLPVLLSGGAIWVRRSLRGTATHKVAQLLLLTTSSAVMSYGVLGRSLADGKHILATFGLGRMLEKNLPVGSSISIYPAGTLAYYANQFYYVDIFGKNDRHLAHLERYLGPALGHNKLDFDYVYDGRKVDVAFIIGPCAHLAAESARVSATQHELSPWQMDMTHPTFRARYLANQVRYVGVPTPTATECLFVREGADIPLFWSSAGTPERASDVRLSCDDRDDHKPAALGPGWMSSPLLLAKSTCSLEAGGRGIVDFWIDIGRAGKLELCTTSGADGIGATVNGESVVWAAGQSRACDGTVLEAEVPAGVLARNRNVTRVQIAAGSSALAIDWIRWKTL